MIKPHLKRLKENLAVRYITAAKGRALIARDGFWFVDIPRTSSSSIRAELGKAFGEAHGKVAGIDRKHVTSQLYPDHMPALSMRALLGIELWSELFTFTIVRNPWERTLSMYHYRRVTQRLPKDFTFGAYVEMLGNKRMRQRYFRYRGYRLGAADYLLDEKDQLLVKHVIYFEHRERDVALVREKLKLPNLGTLKIQKARPEGQHYTDQYTPHTREIISQVYARDIACFGYHFGD